MHVELDRLLAGDTKPGDMCYAKLLYASALLENGALRMDWFAGALGASGFQHIVYYELHDEAGNSDGPFYDPEYTRNVEYPKTHTSHRAIRVAVNDAPLFGDTRRYAEARCRFACALSEAVLPRKPSPAHSNALTSASVRVRMPRP